MEKISPYLKSIEGGKSGGEGRGGKEEGEGRRAKGRERGRRREPRESRARRYCLRVTQSKQLLQNTNNSQTQPLCDHGGTRWKQSTITARERKGP